MTWRDRGRGTIAKNVWGTGTLTGKDTKGRNWCFEIGKQWRKPEAAHQAPSLWRSARKFLEAIRHIPSKCFKGPTTGERSWTPPAASTSTVTTDWPLETSMTTALTSFTSANRQASLTGFTGIVEMGLARTEPSKREGGFGTMLE